MIEWAATKLRALQFQVELVDIGTQTLADGKTIPLPKALLGTLGNV